MPVKTPYYRILYCNGLNQFKSKLISRNRSIDIFLTLHDNNLGGIVKDREAKVVEIRDILNNKQIGKFELSTNTTRLILYLSMLRGIQMDELKLSIIIPSENPKHKVGPDFIRGLNQIQFKRLTIFTAVKAFTKDFVSVFLPAIKTSSKELVKFGLYFEKPENLIEVGLNSLQPLLNFTCFEKLEISSNNYVLPQKLCFKFAAVSFLVKIELACTNNNHKIGYFILSRYSRKNCDLRFSPVQNNKFGLFSSLLILKRDEDVIRIACFLPELERTEFKLLLNKGSPASSAGFSISSSNVGNMSSEEINFLETRYWLRFNKIVYSQ